MTETWISADLVFDGFNLLKEQAVRLDQSRIGALRPVAEINPSLVQRHHPGLLTSGFFDIQINGGGGALLNNDPTPNGVGVIAKAHRKLGTTDLLPTVITDSAEVIEMAARAVLRSDFNGVRGLHIEGPHISQRRRGTHRGAFLRPFDQRSLDLVRELRSEGLALLITVAPEAIETAQIESLVEMGVLVSLGHSDATSAQVQHCLKAGAQAFTHLYNAMSQMESRAPGMVGTAIASEAWCSIIADGIHVDPVMVMNAIRARPVPDRMIAVSDAMATVGGPDHFSLYGQDIHLKEGCLVNAEGSLAGAHLTMLEAIQNLVRWGLPLEEALRMGIHNPAQLMGIWPELGLIGRPLDDVILTSPTLDLLQQGLEL